MRLTFRVPAEMINLASDRTGAHFKGPASRLGTKLVPLASSSRRPAGIPGHDCRTLFLVGLQVAMLVFFPASTPARIVSAEFDLRHGLADAEGFLEYVNHAHFKITVFLSILPVGHHSQARPESRRPCDQSVFRKWFYNLESQDATPIKPANYAVPRRLSNQLYLRSYKYILFSARKRTAPWSFY